MVDDAHAAVAEKVRAFYEANPFPAFDAIKYSTPEDVRARASPYATMLDGQLPLTARIADVGCGTGQLAVLLALRSGRHVVGVDFSSRSLQFGRSLKAKLGLANLTFAEGNVLELDLPSDSFDYVFCNGVLHHTPAPLTGFAQLVRITRPGGYVTVGLYNRYGRLWHRTLRWLYRRAGGSGRALAGWGIRRMLGRQYESLDLEKRRTWEADQFAHPHESVHTVGEVLGWFAYHGVEYAASVPPIALGADPGHVNMFPRRTHDARAALRRLGARMSELVWIWQLRWTGGYFLVVGRKGAR